MYSEDVAVDKEKIVPVDFVVKKTYLEAVGKKRFSTVFSSHVIEHTANIIGHLTEVADILEDGGHYVLCVPDKRITFDYFREVTSFRDAYDVYMNGDKALERLIIDSILNTDYHINYPLSFINVAVDKTRIDEVKRINEDYCKDTIGYFHYWVFTYFSFLMFLRDCLRMNLLPFILEYSSGTIFNSNEFYIVLKKDKGIQREDDKRQAEILKTNKLIENPVNTGLSDLFEFVDKYNSIYIYGLTGTARFMLNVLNSKIKISGFIISDGFNKQESIHPVFHLSEIKLTQEIGIILAMSEKNNDIIKSKLLGMNFSNIYSDAVFID